MGINPRPPIMSREEFETQKADLWRKRAMESVAAKAPAPAATAEKVLKKTNAKASVQKGKILEVVKEVPLDPMAEKLRQESMVGGVEGPDRIFVGGLPYYFTEAQIRALLESFGPLRGFDLVKDRDTGNSKGYGFCVYKDPAATEIACAALNGLKMGDKTLTVRRATMRGRGQRGYVPNKLAATSFASTSIQSIPSFTSKFVPPTTSASTSAAASASASASMHEVTLQASYLDTSSTDCCIADTTERKKGRGKSRSLALLKIKSQGKRLDVEICRITGNPLGPWSGPLSDEQLSIEVFGRKSGYISGLGRGPKPSTTASGRRTRAALEIENEETRRELEEQRRINEELNARVHNLESNSVEVNAKIDLVLQQISRGGFTSDLPS